MSSEPRSLSSVALLARAAGVAAMFFYPLTAALATQSFFLHWRHADSAMLGLSFAITTALLTTALAVIERLRSSVLAVAATALLVAIPLYSFSMQLSRELKLVDELGRMMRFQAQHRTSCALLAVVVATAVLVLAWRHPASSRNLARTLLLVTAPLALLWGLTLARVAHIDTVTELSNEAAVATSGDDGSVFLFLFDQLSYSALHDEHGRIRADYPHFRDFAATARRYHRARSPGSHTGTALPSLLLGTRDLGALEARGAEAIVHHRDGRRAPLDLTRHNLFGAARTRGFVTAMVGWYFPYCDLLEGDVDHCMAFSAYSVATLRRASPLNAVLTNVILWPHEAPILGPIKNAVACDNQRRMVESSERFARAVLRAPGRQFLFAHFSIPHWPFAFAGLDYHPADNPYGDSDSDYAAQLRYTDGVLGRLVGELRSSGRLDRSHVMVLSDHEHRGRIDLEHVPILWRQPGQVEGVDVFEEVAAESIVWELVESRPSDSRSADPAHP